MVRFFHFSCENLYSNFALIMILFLMLTSIFSHNFIALGYFIFSMVLIYNYRNFFKESEARDNQIIILKYFLLPYLLMDIFA
jgi:multisubunit Na+/H+ antiporter MnhE subunit